MPIGLQAPSAVLPEDDPDPAVSGPARARIEAEARRCDPAAAARANEQAVREEELKERTRAKVRS